MSEQLNFDNMPFGEDLDDEIDAELQAAEMRLMILGALKDLTDRIAKGEITDVILFVGDKDQNLDTFVALGSMNEADLCMTLDMTSLDIKQKRLQSQQNDL